MDRRSFFMGAGALLLLPTKSFAQQWGEGELVQQEFRWTNGGGDPYQGSLENALQLGGIDARMNMVITQDVANHPNGNAARYTIQDGERLGVMISGQVGWVARHTVAWPSRWQTGRSRQASVWYVYDQATGVQYRLMKADVCGNWLVEYFGAPERCRCIVGVDAC